MGGGLANLGETLSEKLDCGGFIEWLCAPTSCCPEWLISPELAEHLSEKAKEYGPVMSGALFGAGVWFWVDACAASGVTIPWVHYIPGVVALLALIMINAVRRDDLAEEDPFDEGAYMRARVWLFLSYLMSFGAIIGSIVIFVTKYAQPPEVTNTWPGIAGILEVCCILGSSLVFFISRTPSSGGNGYGSYSAF